MKWRTKHRRARSMLMWVRFYAEKIYPGVTYKRARQLIRERFAEERDWDAMRATISDDDIPF